MRKKITAKRKFILEPNSLRHIVFVPSRPNFWITLSDEVFNKAFDFPLQIVTSITLYGDAKSSTKIIKLIEKFSDKSCQLRLVNSKIGFLMADVTESLCEDAHTFEEWQRSVSYWSWVPEVP
ncbi:hypothetical protein RvY_10863-1 [Ramazzottius varieornatus]|uniref:Uncharacterized protein n=1 Tax=Ramazzottius varieornatus TaxID=947166 RepID=A0A1D1VG80_RAMVA|nr:hypothetical protein RvY_10863-1 [Ramazzottius varieornatus]